MDKHDISTMGLHYRLYAENKEMWLAQAILQLAR